VHPLDLPHFGGQWIFESRVRYYTQTAADFYQDIFPRADFSNFMARDKELATYSAITAGLTATYEFKIDRFPWLSKGSLNLRAFYLRRVLRILPPFYTVLALAIVLTLAGVLPGALDAKAIVAQFVHYGNYWQIGHGMDGQAVGTNVYWSLAVEEHFYLVFPLLYLLARRLWPGDGRSQALFFYALCALGLAWRLVLVYCFDASVDRTYLASDTRMDSILFGCALAVGANPMLDAARGTQSMRRWVWFPLAMAVLVATFAARSIHFRETFRYSIQGIALTAVFIAAMRDSSWGAFRWLNTKPMKVLGGLSYSLYLVHNVVHRGVDRWLPSLGGVVRACIALAISMLLAELIRRFIEAPCARLRRRLEPVVTVGAVKP
jgi:peptidoglycan/LPS O-acetylase OafA/YrhL